MFKIQSVLEILYLTNVIQHVNRSVEKKLHLYARYNALLVVDVPMACIGPPKLVISATKRKIVQKVGVYEYFLFIEAFSR